LAERVRDRLSVLGQFRRERPVQGHARVDNYVAYVTSTSNTTPREGNSDVSKRVERDRRYEPRQRAEQDSLVHDRCDESDDDAQQAQQAKQ
jgi:hypothetical protein